MAIPDLLKQHIEELRSEGYIIDVIDGDEIGIIFRNYPISQIIWNREMVDLLVLAHPSYPNPKMDMFWVDPPLTLKDGRVPNATGTANKFGKQWQQFSWHVNTWNPSHDNLLTYLDVINNRLRKAQ